MHGCGDSGDMASHESADRQLITIIRCHKDGVPKTWPKVKGYFERALKAAPPWWSIEGLEQRAASGHYTLWLIFIGQALKAAALSEYEQYDLALVCNVPWIGGVGMNLWLPTLNDTVTCEAKQMGATYLAGAGREGWARANGMKQIGTILIKEI